MGAPTVYRTTARVAMPQVRLVTDVSAFLGLDNVDILAVGDQVRAGELYNLFSTLVGDEPFLPTYGCDLPKRVFQPLTPALRQELLLDVYMSGKTWIPDAPVVMGASIVDITSGNRVAGVTVAYEFEGDRWYLPINFS